MHELRTPEENSHSLPKTIGRFSHFLASSFHSNRTGKCGKTKIPKTVEDTIRLMEPVAPLLANWPQGFEGHVEQRLQDGDPNTTSAPERLGNWYHRLIQFRDPAYDPFKQAVGRAIERKFNGLYSGRLVASASRDWVSAKEAAKNLGITSQRLDEAVQQREIAGKIGQSGLGHEHVVIPKFEVLNIASERRLFWSGTQVRAYLGIGRKHFDLLKETDLIVEIPSSERPALVDGRFYSDSVKELVALIRTSAREAVGDSTP